MQEKFELT